MGGIVGILGEGSLADLQAMAARMAYRGRPRTWSPAPGVYFGELAGAEAARHSENSSHANTGLALDSARGTTPRLQIEALLQREGDAAASSIEGFFALAWWDDARSTLKFICDRHSYKTLYVACLPGRVVFASDCKALLALGEFPATVDRSVLQEYLRSRSFSSDRSLLAQAKPVGGAFVWSVTRSGVLTKQPYWRALRRDEVTAPALSFDTAATRLRGILQSALSRRLLNRSHTAIALSGGLDSVAVLATARSVQPDLRVSSYTVGHGREDPEIVRAREAAEHFRTEHHEVFLPPEQLPGELERLVWLTEDLTGREEAVLQQVLTDRMAANERDYIAGHGADAVFAGMPRHRLLWLRDHAPWPLRGALDELFVYTRRRVEPKSWLGQRLATLTYKGDRPALPVVEGARQVADVTPHDTLDTYWRETISGTIEGMRFHEPLEADGDITMYSPFFEPAVVDFALTCPIDYLIDARKQKRLLRAAVKSLLPEQISGRRKLIQRMKHDTALSDVLDDFAARLHLRESLAARQLVPASYLSSLQKRRRTQAYPSERLHILWAMVCAELWMRQFIDERGKVPPGTLPSPLEDDTSVSGRFATA